MQLQEQDRGEGLSPRAFRQRTNHRERCEQRLNSFPHPSRLNPMACAIVMNLQKLFAHAVAGPNGLHRQTPNLTDRPELFEEFDHLSAPRNKLLGQFAQPN